MIAVLLTACANGAVIDTFVGPDLAVAIGCASLLFSSIAFDSQGNGFYACCNAAILFHDRHHTNQLSVLAGSPKLAGVYCDNCQATSSSIIGVHAMKVDPDEGYLYLSDSSYNIRRIDLSTHIISRVAGSSQTFLSQSDDTGDDGPATSAKLGPVYGFHFHSSRFLFFADSTRIRRVDLKTGIIQNYAGSFSGSLDSSESYSGGFFESTHNHRDGPLATALFDSPGTLWGDNEGREMIVSDTCTFRKIDMVVGIVSTWWGGSDCWSSGDGGSIQSATVHSSVKICGKDKSGKRFDFFLVLISAICRQFLLRRPDSRSLAFQRRRL